MADTMHIFIMHFKINFRWWPPFWLTLADHFKSIINVFIVSNNTCLVIYTYFYLIYLLIYGLFLKYLFGQPFWIEEADMLESVRNKCIWSSIFSSAFWNTIQMFIMLFYWVLKVIFYFGGHIGFEAKIQMAQKLILKSVTQVDKIHWENLDRIIG